MVINKFGGASVKDAASVQRMASICKNNIQNGVIVVSAMGKTTNLLEKLSHEYFNGSDTSVSVQQFKQFHWQMIEELFEDSTEVHQAVNVFFHGLEQKLQTPPGLNFDFEYDQIVPLGELVSTTILSHYLNQNGFANKWVDVRTCLKTDSTYREGQIDWNLTQSLCSETMVNFSTEIYLTQGFIGSDINGLNTTLGREGSDYTAAVLANVLNAQQVNVWKDVPGIMTADPAWLHDVEKIDYLSYYEAIELTYFGAKVIHPKTIKPLRNKNIPLYVRSFIQPEQSGTTIGHQRTSDVPKAVYIRKENQTLISISPRDFSFIVEENLSRIFSILSKYRVKVNLMQNSAMKFALAVDGGETKLKKAIEVLKKEFNTKYNENLEIITIRHPENGKEQNLIEGRKIYLEQRSRSTVSYVLK